MQNVITHLDLSPDTKAIIASLARVTWNLKWLHIMKALILQPFWKIKLVLVVQCFPNI